MAWNVGGNTGYNNGQQGGYGYQNSNNQQNQNNYQTGSGDREYSWDGDTISKDDEFILLEPGDYPFTIEKFERSRSQGSEKMPPCNMAVVYFTVHSNQGDVTVKENYLLHSKFEWKLSQLFTSVGLKKKGEPCPLNFTALPGRTGTVRIKNEPGTGQYAGSMFNRVDRLVPAQ